MSTPEPTEEELREALAQLRVEDVVLQTVVTLVNVAGTRLTAEGAKDLEQARQAIEAVRALLPLCPQDELGPVRDAVSQLQMIYVRESGDVAGGEAPPPAPPTAEPQQAPKPEEAPSRIWTPPGS
ncbi:MAG: hypothetical protein M3350_00320 [Actinomycetota bacterium]|nr:hypothetical protein [Actinomycetota bacterium]MDQ3719233.1 hypothetical protein [Actinomycetota bacterium]